MRTAAALAYVCWWLLGRALKRSPVRLRWVLVAVALALITGRYVAIWGSDVAPPPNLGPGCAAVGRLAVERMGNPPHAASFPDVPVVC